MHLGPCAKLIRYLLRNNNVVKRQIEEQTSTLTIYRLKTCFSQITACEGILGHKTD